MSNRFSQISIILFFAAFCASISAAAQDSAFSSARFSIATTKYTTLPVRLPVSMSGGFAEIRPNHFHSGLDIRTGGKEGERVYAPNDGYVSRINISAWGGGKVLYITHPDGFRTVYMHLSEFCGEIGRFVHNYQYAHHTFAFDIELPKDSIRVTKGQLVALTGNTGGSAGPHLHYEIRYAENDQTINPLYFGLPYSDPIAPTIENIKLYPADSRTLICGSNSEYFLSRKSKNGKKSSWTSDTIPVAGRFYTGIYTYDGHETGSASKNGVDRIELYIDGHLFHRYTVPTFMFEETRAINAIIDYPQYQRNRHYYILSRRLRGDRNNFSTALRDNGYIFFDDGKVHRLEYRVSDHKGNTSRRQFFVRDVSSAKPASETNSSEFLQPTGEPITYYKRFAMQKPGFKVEMQPYTIYDNDQLTYFSAKDAASLSPVHRIALRRHPLPPHQSFDVTIAIPSNITDSLVSKLTIVCINGNKASALPTRREGSNLSAPTRSFGGFALRADTVPPTIKPTNFSDGKPFVGKQLIVKIGDNLTGIVAYECYINGQWQLAEHDGKISSLTVSASHLQRGTNRVIFRLTDAVGNSTEQSYTLTFKP